MTRIEIAGLILAGLYLVAELVAVFTGQRTFSALIRDAGSRYWFWPALFGLLGGHFFGPSWMRPLSWGQWVALGLLLMVVGKDLLWSQRIEGVEWVVFLAFLLAGAVLWAQGGKG